MKGVRTMYRIVSILAIVIASIMIAVPVAAATAVPVFGFFGIDSITDAIGVIMGTVITVAIPIFGKRFVNTTKRRNQAGEWDKIADGIIGAIRINNPANPVVEMVDDLQNQVFDQLKANPEVTNSSSVIRRIASAAIMRALDAQGATGKK